MPENPVSGAFAKRSFVAAAPIPDPSPMEGCGKSGFQHQVAEEEKLGHLYFPRCKPAHSFESMIY